MESVDPFLKEFEAKMKSVAKKSFDPSAFDEFLANGWLLDLGQRGLAVGWGKWQEFDSMHAECSLYVPTFHPQSESQASSTQAPRTWRMTENWDILNRDFFASQVIAAAPHKVNGDVQGFQWVEPRREGFDQAFLAIREGFRSRGLTKAVPVVFAHAQGSLNSMQLSKILQRLAAAPRSLRLYGMWSNDAYGAEAGVETGIIGATPETLFERHCGRHCGRHRGKDRGDLGNHTGEDPREENSTSRLLTMALAGTTRKPSTPDETEAAKLALLQDPKERHEHEIVIEDISAALRHFGEVRRGQTDVMELPTLLHLHTQIEAEIPNEISLETLVAALHPTPALGVAPRALGFEEIRRWDDQNERGRFGAPFGIRLRDRGEVHETVLVAIRNLEWKGEELRVGSGCGVVPMSDVEREWQELALKRSAVRGMLGV